METQTQPVQVQEQEQEQVQVQEPVQESVQESVQVNNAETFQFKAEISQLMDLIVNTFYSNKDIFLRELVSNASDALNKVRYESLTDRDVLKSEERFVIQLIPNKENKTLTIRDTGIGMTKEELKNNLGVIARSGTKIFEELQKSKDARLIGKFGVGFYSAFLVADKVQVMSKHNSEDKTHMWESDAKGSFNISDCDPQHQLTRGTSITLHLKDEHCNYLEEHTIKKIVEEHSQFINFDIELWCEKEKEVDVDDEEEEAQALAEQTAEQTAEQSTEQSTEQAAEQTAEQTAEAQASAEQTVEQAVEKSETEIELEQNAGANEADGVVVEEEDADDNDDDDAQSLEKANEAAKEKKTRKVKYNEFEKVNKTKPIWARDPSEVTEEEYAEFYKTISKDWEKHLAVKHFKLEGNVNFRALLFLPKRAPFDMFQQKKKQNNIKLHVRKVFITDNCENLFPEYLNFMKGVVDCEDLPLNVSREMLQENKQIAIIKKQLTKKSLELFSELAKEDDKYKEFYDNFSKNIKLGIHEDSKNRDKLVELLRFTTSKDQSKDNPSFVSLKEYVENMPSHQKNIYYITGESLDAVKNSPFLEVVTKKGFEVLFLTQVIDEYCIQQVKEYQGKSLVCITKEGLEFEQNDEEKKDWDKLKEQYKELLEKVKQVLGDKVEKVVLSNRIEETPSVLVTSQHGWSANMERIMKAQAMRNEAMDFMSGKKILEINPNHVLIKNMLDKFNKDKNDKLVDDVITLLYDSSLLSSGFHLPDPTSFTKRFHRMMVAGLTGLAMDDEPEPSDDVQVEAESTDQGEVEVQEPTDQDKAESEATDQDKAESTDQVEAESMEQVD